MTLSLLYSLQSPQQFSSLNSILLSKPLMETFGRAAQSQPAFEKLVQCGLLDLVSESIKGKMFIEQPKFH